MDYGDNSAHRVERHSFHVGDFGFEVPRAGERPGWRGSATRAGGERSSSAVDKVAVSQTAIGDGGSSGRSKTMCYDLCFW